MRRALLPVLVVVFAACPSTPLPDGGFTDDAGTGQLLLVFDGDFGEVERFTTATNPARFVNVGEVPAAISQLSIDGEGFSLGAFDEAPIAPGRSRDVPVHFRPTRNGPHSARISFQATTLPVLASFSMEGTGVGAMLRISSELELGTQTQRGSEVVRASGFVRLENVGDRWLYFQPDVPWFVTPAEELCAGDLDGTGHCTNAVSGFDLNSGIAPGRSLDVPIHFASTVPGARSWVLTVRTELKDMPDFQVPIRVTVMPESACRLEADVAALDFGDAEPTHAVDLSFTLRNTGTINCELREPTFTSRTAFGVIAPQGWPRILPPGHTLDVTVRAQPTIAVGPQRDVLFVGSSRDGVSVPLQVRAAKTCLSLRTPTDLGAVPLSCPDPKKTLSFTNWCTTPVMLTSLQSSGGSFTTPAPWPRTLNRTATYDVEARLVGRATWTLEVATDTGVERHVRQVTGRKVASVETERREALRKADVLVVFDRTPQSLSVIRAQLGTLYSQLLANGVDFQLGALPTDAVNSRLISAAGRRWLTRQSGSDADFINLFAGASPVGSGAAAVVAAMSAPMSTEDLNNRGFFRPDAALIVVLISSATEVTTANEDALLAFKPDLVVHTVSGTCPGATEPTSRRLAELTGGTAISCGVSWSQFVSDVVSSASGARRRLNIASQVTPGTMSVRGLDASAWTYSAPWLSIPAGAPPPVEVTFTPSCE